MQISSLFALCCGLFWSEVVFADGENEAKRGAFPFMAFLYYPDETIVDATGARFVRAAVLIRPEWLISSAIDHSVLDNIPLGFPRKTLLARLGAVAVDANFTLNEDEDEQEREIIQIVRPKSHNVEEWWLTDITLLKTLLPFNMTTAVAITSISTKRDFADKNCIILLYAKKYGNFSEDKVLMQLSVELLPPTMNNCGSQFNDNTMICGVDSEETRNIYDTEFCLGNSGGPLMCEGEVMGLQTYIDNNCRQPHLYQLLSSWNHFISCGSQEKCDKDYCANICTVTNKDAPLNERTISPTHPIFETSTSASDPPEFSDTEITTTSSSPTMEISSEEPEMTTTMVESTEPPTTTTAPPPTTTPTTTVTASTTHSPITTTKTNTVSWPNESPKQNLRKLDQSFESDVVPERHAKMEAQRQQDVKPKARGSAQRNMCLLQSLFLGYFVLICVI